MYGLFENADLQRSLELLSENGFELVIDNVRPSVVDTKNKVKYQEYQKSNKIVTILNSKQSNESDDTITIDFIILVDDKRETIKFCVKTYDEVKAFVDADEAEVNEMFIAAMKSRAEAVSSFTKSLK